MARRTPQRTWAYGGERGRAVDEGGRPRARGRPYLGARAGDPNGSPRAGGDGPDMDPGAAQLAPQRTALRRPPGLEQEGDLRAVWRRQGQGLAAQLRRPAAGIGTQRRASSVARPAIRRPTAGGAPQRRMPEGRRGADAPVLV